LRDHSHIDFVEEVYKVPWFLKDRLHRSKGRNGKEEQGKGAQGKSSGKTEGQEGWEWRLMDAKFCT
jgi:hypothetical protein